MQRLRNIDNCIKSRNIDHHSNYSKFQSVVRIELFKLFLLSCKCLAGAVSFAVERLCHPQLHLELLSADISGLELHQNCTET